MIVFAVVLPWLLIALGCWLGFQLVRQNGRILLQLEAVEQHLAELASASPVGQARQSGLPLGMSAPPFSLPALHGGAMSLAQLRGRRVLLVFFNPGCGFCREMAPDLAALPPGGSDGLPLPVVISSGEAEATRQLVAEHRIACPVLLQDGLETASAYQVTGTPMGYLIDEQGRVASGLAKGAQAILALAADAAETAQELPANVDVAERPGRARARGNRSLSESRIVRDGLPAGTVAPKFQLARLDGGTVSLDDYRGRRLLMVLSDPACGPCEQLAPALEQLHRRRPDLEMLVISRGDADTNRAKALRHDLTMPIALQRHWELSRAYGIFATPSAYLIDEQGVIGAEVAQGPEAILALVTTVAAGTLRKEDVSTDGAIATDRESRLQRV